MARAACPDRRLLESSLRGKARSMLFSNSVVDEFCEEATLPEMRAVEGLLARQMEVRAANQLERRMRRARFPAAKSLDGYDFSQVSFPDGYGEADLRSLAFIDACQDFGLATLVWTVPGGAQETGGPYMRDPRHPRHFTDEFKRQIVDLYNAGKPKREIMDEYDLGKSTVERWIKSINATGSPRAADNRTPEQNRILELERENRRLRMEVDVLKQAALIYARK